MNDTLTTIHCRRSIRKYKPDQIADGELKEILNAAIFAPNARNQQQWHFTVIQDRALLDRIVSIIKENILGSDNAFLKQRASSLGYHTFHHAPTVVMISAAAEAHLVQLDCGAAMQNMVLAAESLRVGSCIIASSAMLFASEKGNRLAQDLGIPNGYQHICCVALGYKDGADPAAPPRNRDVFNYIQ